MTKENNPAKQAVVENAMITKMDVTLTMAQSNNSNAKQ